MAINTIHVVGASALNVGDRSNWWGEFYWPSGPGPAGRSGQIAANFVNTGCCSARNLNNQSIGWFLACAASSCSGFAQIQVGELELTAEETRAPSLAPAGTNNLWNQPGWVRGIWNASTYASDPSGTCGVFVVFGTLPAFSGAPEYPHRNTFKQCLDQGAPATVDTRASQGTQGAGEGVMGLRFTATNAAGVTANEAKTVYVDNSVPTISLSGPTESPSTAGTRYMTATAAGGPSGIAGILCTSDGGPPQWSSGPIARVPVSGIGQHLISCAAANNAVDPAGAHGWSAPASRSLKIARPTVLSVSFDRIVNALRCGRVRERVVTGGRWVTIHRHGRPIWVYVHRRTRPVTITRCHPRTAVRRTFVLVTVRRHGRLVKICEIRSLRVVIPPYVSRATVKRIPFGHRATVSGWLGTFDGVALQGRAVQILTAPEDGRSAFTATSSAYTRPDGSWTAELPDGPSRSVEAVYAGGLDTEPTSSSPVRVVVPAGVRIRVRPMTVPWGGRIRISGRVLGGHIPRGSNILKLLFGDGPKPHTIGTPDIDAAGRFSIPIAWSSGRGLVRYWFAVATLAEADYPFAVGTSPRVPVTVGSLARPSR